MTKRTKNYRARARSLSPAPGRAFEAVTGPKPRFEAVSAPISESFHEITAAVTPKRLLPSDSATRKRFAICSGVVDYFPDALAAVAEVSYVGNEKHNPGQPMHHARGKSMDHADCIMRHLMERGGFDGPLRHSAALAWRALVLLQEELEREHGLDLPRNAKE